MSRKNDLYLLSEAYTKVNENTNKLTPHPDLPGEGPGGNIELIPGKDGRYYHPEPPKQGENAENLVNPDEPGGPQEGEDWKAHMTRNIVHKGSEFLRGVYELGYTGEAGEADINEIVEQLASEAEADDRLKRALEEVITYMVNAGQADH